MSPSRTPTVPYGSLPDSSANSKVDEIMILLQIDDDADAAKFINGLGVSQEEDETETVIGCTREFDLTHTHRTLLSGAKKGQ